MSHHAYPPPYQPERQNSFRPLYEIVVYPAHTYPSQGRGGSSGYPSTGGGYPSTGGGYPSPGGGYPAGGQNPQEGMTLSDVYDYDDGPSRNKFLRIVFLLLSILLAVTALFVVLCMFHMPLKLFLVKHFWIAVVGAILYIISSIAFSCCPISRSVPWNYLFLCMSVIGLSLISGCLSVKFNTSAILLAFVITLVLCLFLTALALTSFDFTRFILYVMVFGLVFMMLSVAFLFLSILKSYIKPFHMLLCVMAVMYNAMMFVMQLQMILGGRAMELETDEYVYGTWALYISIMQMFLNILRIIGMIGDDD